MKLIFLESFQRARFYGGDFVNFWIQETLNFEWFLIIGNW